MEHEPAWWLSFADETGFLGVVITRAPAFMLAVMKTHALGTNPGGEVQGFEVPLDCEHRVRAKDFDKLLSLEDLQEHYDPIKLSELEKAVAN